MSIRTKNAHRLLLLLSLAVVGTGALAGTYYARRGYLNASAMHDRELGLAAVKAGDYPSGLTELGHYLGRFAERAEAHEIRYADALFNYALARQMVEEPKEMHLVTAVSLWKRYMALRPDNAQPPQLLEARHWSLDAQMALGWLPEALDTAQDILKTDSNDLKSLSVRTQILHAQRKFPEAQAAAQAWAKAYPHDFDALLMLEQAKSQQDPEHATEIFANDAAALLKSEPNEPRFELLASLAADLGIDLTDKKAASLKLSEAARKALAAEAGNLSDVEIVQRLVQQLDTLWVQSIVVGDQKQLGIAGKGLELARKSFESHPDDLEFRRLYAFELFQSGGSKQVETLLDKTTPDAAQADGRLLAIKALVEFNLGLVKEGRALLATAAQRGAKDPAVAALCEALTALLVTALDDANAMADLQTTLNDPAAKLEDCKPKLQAFVQAHPDDTEAFTNLQAILNNSAATRADILAKLDAYRLAIAQTLQETCKSAAAIVPSDPLISYLLAEASLRAGNADVAAKALMQTLSVAPAWVQANLRLAQLAVSLHQADAAVMRADIVLALGADDPNMLVFATLIHASMAAPGQTEQINKALALLQELQRRVADKIPPDAKQQIATQLSRLGRNQEAIQLLAATTPPGPSQTATRPGSDALLLAQLYAGQKRYPEAQALYDQLLAKEPTVDVIIYAADLAGSLGQKDKVNQIMAKLDALKSQPGGREMVWADYYSRHGTPQQAIDSWKAAIKANPANPKGWQLLLAFCLQTPSTPQFDGAASFFANFAEARKAVPADPAISPLIALQDTPGRKRESVTPTLLDELCQDLFIRSLIVAQLDLGGGSDGPVIKQCLDDVANSQKAMDTLPEMSIAASHNIQEQLIPVLQKLVYANPSVLPVQNLLIAFYGLSARYDQCVAMATRYADFSGQGRRAGTNRDPGACRRRPLG